MRCLFCRRSNAAVTTCIAVLLSLATFPLAIVQAQDDPFEQFPLVIQCKSNETYHTFYLSRISQDGIATYRASERIAGTITLDGKAKATGSEGGGTCVGKTLTELRASHQAYDLKR
ncbi:MULTISPECIES: hypothetical protein [Rhizobium]|uniref:hypothetical protein n=1 Tax=Rhizobium TaxID=379 RepID=UPI001B32CDB3|nr:MULTISPECIES: hypothetical protein [Rhizobium]MBX4908459.1 hypothetical protein [Rhizobium bangladeshense]MBX5222235.1 hypothetical protein [Rhizobium sp. NLR8a]MBX5226228.1 hypothetical protein [Rhizobium sp. NLR9b]MBX5233676.1 hypothetical protein [Rhizobium sp. NLR4a]MBX5239545.1 hypothetical protein [Rhizobium sp. NLR22b]